MVAPLLQIPGIPGGSELLIVLLIAVLLFGANKIPKLARSSGQAIGEFQKGREEVEQELSEIKEGPGDEEDEVTTTETTETTTETDTPTDTDTETETSSN